MSSLQTGRTNGVRRFWSTLWLLALGLLLLQLFATLAERPLDPEALRHFPEAVLQRGRQFSREVHIAGTTEALLSLIMLLWLCFTSSGAALLSRFEALGGRRPWLRLLTILAGVMLLSSLIELPIAYYLGYIHEKAYGLTRQTPIQWLAEYGKSLGLSILLASILFLPLYALIRRSPARWWISGTLVSLLLSGLLSLLAPTLLLPLFHDAVPVREPAVAEMAEKLARRAGVQIGAVYELLVSEKTARANAMVVGFGPTKRVYIHDTMLQQFQPDEVEVVLAHEFAHAAHQDVFLNWLLSGTLTAGTLFLAAWVLRSMIGAAPLYLPAAHGPRGLVLLMLLLVLVGQVMAPIENLVSRQMEERADAFALDLTGKHQAFISGFSRLAQGNPSDVDPPAVVEFLSHSHPSIMNRIRFALRASGR